jgi:response regulator RpfG family c-di-GMP phosphodiesterase
MITAEAGKQFDPQVVEAFNSISDEQFAEVSAEIG